MPAKQVVLPLLSRDCCNICWVVSAKTRASRTGMEDVSPIITSADGKQQNKEDVFLTGSDLFRSGLFHAYKGHYYFWRKPKTQDTRPFELLPFPRCYTGVYWKLQPKAPKAELGHLIGP